MSDQLVLIFVIIGGAIGIALVGVAMWMMRSEMPAEPKPEQSTPVADPQLPAEPTPAPQVEAVPASSVEPVETSAEVVASIEPETPPAPPASPPISTSTSAASSWLNSLAARGATTAATSTGGEQLLSLWRSPEGELVIEVNGKRFRTRQELIDAGLEGRVANAAHDLGFLLDSPANAAVSATTIPAPSQVNGSGHHPPNSARPVTKISLEEAAKMEIKRPSMDIPKQFRYLREQQKQPEIQIKTVAEEIDEVLQVQIMGTALVGRGLKVSDSKHGVSFSLDGRNYDSLDSMPDGDARNAIRAAIQKWDQK